jgi:murein DD-endopeptidase MepM/ murein hydrolase activator NlpD
LKQISDLQIAKRCIYPHQQYKSNKKSYEFLNYPLVSFGFEDQHWGIHVGEDSGWLFSGMSVHSIMDGIVAKIQYIPTWGVLIAIQSRLCDSSIVTAYYGHLSCTINVAIGDLVKVGDKISEIAPSFTYSNGGYFSHLHLGVEKSDAHSAIIKGWYDSTENWYSPISFVANYGKNCK